MVHEQNDTMCICTHAFYCKVYYADLFYQLRMLIFENDEEK